MLRKFNIVNLTGRNTSISMMSRMCKLHTTVSSSSSTNTKSNTPRLQFSPAISAMYFLNIQMQSRFPILSKQFCTASKDNTTTSKENIEYDYDDDDYDYDSDDDVIRNINIHYGDDMSVNFNAEETEELYRMLAKMDYSTRNNIMQLVLVVQLNYMLMYKKSLQNPCKTETENFIDFAQRGDCEWSKKLKEFDEENRNKYGSLSVATFGKRSIDLLNKHFHRSPLVRYLNENDDDNPGLMEEDAENFENNHKLIDHILRILGRFDRDVKQRKEVYREFYRLLLSIEYDLNEPSNIENEAELFRQRREQFLAEQHA